MQASGTLQPCSNVVRETHRRLDVALGSTAGTMKRGHPLGSANAQPSHFATRRSS